MLKDWAPDAVVDLSNSREKFALCEFSAHKASAKCAFIG
jgi:hypothetical protein